MIRFWLLAVAFSVPPVACSEAPDPATFTRSVTLSDAATKTVAPGDWPKWRGPEGDGISRETDWSPRWPAEGPKTLWQAKVGIGFSSVSVADGRLYTMGHRDGSEVVSCFDATTGDEIWTRSYKGKLVNNLHEGGPCSTPTVDGRRLYTLGREGQLHCLKTADGEIVWSKMLQNELGVKLPAWGFTCSPLVVGDAVVVEAGRTVAYDKKTGELMWQTRMFKPGYGSPCVFESDRGLLLAVLNNDALLVLRAEDGSEVARSDWSTQYKASATTPIVLGDEVFISTGYNKGCALLKFAGNRLDYVYDNRNMRNHFNNCVVWEGNIYGIDGQASASRTCKLVCMDWKTGEVRWTERGFGCGSLMIADGALIILSDAGELVTAEATGDRFREISRAQVLSGRCWTVPVLVRGRIYCRNAAGDLICVDVSK